MVQSHAPKVAVGMCNSLSLSILDRLAFMNRRKRKACLKFMRQNSATTCEELAVVKSWERQEEHGYVHTQ